MQGGEVMNSWTGGGVEEGCVCVCLQGEVGVVLGVGVTCCNWGEMCVTWGGNHYWQVEQKCTHL